MGAVEFIPIRYVGARPRIKTALGDCMFLRRMKFSSSAQFSRICGVYAYAESSDTAVKVVLGYWYQSPSTIELVVDFVNFDIVAAFVSLV